MKKKKAEQNTQNITYEFFTLDRKNVEAELSKIDAYFRKNGRTVVD
jgi:hypothetical protein